MNQFGARFLPPISGRSLGSAVAPVSQLRRR
jgi:hypothetical protein